MANPWKEVSLSDYERHMALDSVYQLQTLDQIMLKQFTEYPIKSVVILGIAGGNGLGNLENLSGIDDIYGIDINEEYLKASKERYPLIEKRYHTVLADINEDCSMLPKVDLVIANLFIEYIGYNNFAKAVEVMAPEHVSCVIQIDPAESFVSDSPYTAKLEVLDSVHRSVDKEELTNTLSAIGYIKTASHSIPLPNGKIFLRLDYRRKH